MDEIRQRQQQLRCLALTLAPVADQIRASDFLTPFSPDVASLLATVENSLGLYTLFEKHHITHQEQIMFGWFGLLPEELVTHLFSFIAPHELVRTRRMLKMATSCSRTDVVATYLSAAGLCTALDPRRGMGVALHEQDGARVDLCVADRFQREFDAPEKAHGVGRATYEEACEYQGEFHCGNRQGFGILIKQVGRYEGEWVADKRHGVGYCEFPNGSIYEGQFANDVQEGRGVKRWQNGSCYSGEWRSGQQHGQGMLQWHDGERYEGEWDSGYQTGKGRYTWPDGDEYDGYWHKDLLQGSGMHVWHDGCSFVGEWRDGKRHGPGTYRWPDGSVYEGNFLDSKRHGAGTMQWSDGTSYAGAWAGDCRVVSLAAVNFSAAPVPKLWDLFFHKSYSQQRAYVREVMQHQIQKPIASLT